MKNSGVQQGGQLVHSHSYIHTSKAVGVAKIVSEQGLTVINEFFGAGP